MGVVLLVFVFLFLLQLCFPDVIIFRSHLFSFLESTPLCGVSGGCFFYRFFLRVFILFFCVCICFSFLSFEFVIFVSPFGVYFGDLNLWDGRYSTVRVSGFPLFFSR